MNWKMIGMLAASMALSACSSVTMIDQAQSIPDEKCAVRVFQTQKIAERHGEIEELCIITGTSSMSFVHTVATAIEKHKNKACACGATDVYIQSRIETGWDIAQVTMVAFRYKSKK